MAKLPKINERFAGAYQATDQAQRIAELQAEVDRLRATTSPELEQQMAALRDQLKAQSGELEVAVDLALHNSSMLSIARPQGTNIFQLVIGTVLCFK